MIPFIVYALILTTLILYNGCFNLFKDKVITRKYYALFFIGKIAAVPVFIFVYDKFYGGIKNFDSGKFFDDVLTISDFSKKDLNFFVRMLFGFQDESPGSDDYEHVFKYTQNWNNGKIKDYFYNDNRVLTRFHVVLNFIAFDSYPVHALFSCFMSFIGFNFLYKAIKDWFEGKEMAVLIILCFFPSLWFYTGALLKEGITIFVLGNAVYQAKKIVEGHRHGTRVLWFLSLLFISCLLKPYLLLFSITSFSLFFIITRVNKIKKKIVVFFSLVALAFFLANTFSIVIKSRTLAEAALQQQQRFIGVSKGGIFLEDSSRFIRIMNDSGFVKRVPGKQNYFTINKNVSYMYWRTGVPADTLYCNANTDTISQFELAYMIPESHSNVSIYNPNIFKMIASCYYYTLFYPLFFNAKNALQLMVSFENLMILVALLMISIGILQNRKKHLPPLVFIFFAFALCLLVAFTAPNSGAIFRYRAPGTIFLLLAALYYLKSSSGNLSTKSDRA